MFSTKPLFPTIWLFVPGENCFVKLEPDYSLSIENIFFRIYLSQSFTSFHNCYETIQFLIFSQFPRHLVVSEQYFGSHGLVYRLFLFSNTKCYFLTPSVYFLTPSVTFDYYNFIFQGYIFYGIWTIQVNVVCAGNNNDRGTFSYYVITKCPKFGPPSPLVCTCSILVLLNARSLTSTLPHHHHLHPHLSQKQ